MGLPQAVSGLRELKILKRFRVTPVSPVFVLGVELSMYIVYCIVSLATLAAAALLWGVRLRAGSLPGFLGSWALTMLSTLSIGMLVGGTAKDVKQASVIASIFRDRHGQRSIADLCHACSHCNLHDPRCPLFPLGINHIKSPALIQSRALNRGCLFLRQPLHAFNCG